jgi:hypothetical protein
VIGVVGEPFPVSPIIVNQPPLVYIRHFLRQLPHVYIASGINCLVYFRIDKFRSLSDCLL